jgi:ERCC4-related helicase
MQDESGEAFKNKEVGVLVATDIAARGIDIDQLFVINFDYQIPNIRSSKNRTRRKWRSNLQIVGCKSKVVSNILIHGILKFGNSIGGSTNPKIKQKWRSS